MQKKKRAHNLGVAGGTEDDACTMVSGGCALPEHTVSRLSCIYNSGFVFNPPCHCCAQSVRPVNFLAYSWHSWIWHVQIRLGLLCVWQSGSDVHVLPYGLPSNLQYAVMSVVIVPETPILPDCVFDSPASARLLRTSDCDPVLPATYNSAWPLLCPLRRIHTPRQTMLFQGITQGVIIRVGNVLHSRAYGQNLYTGIPGVQCGAH